MLSEQACPQHHHSKPQASRHIINLVGSTAQVALCFSPQALVAISGGPGSTLTKAPWLCQG